MKRRILAALMCLCMLVGLLPTSVFAKKSELPESNDTVEYTASRVENISKLDGNKSTNDQIVAAAIWKTVENGQEMFYVAVAYAKQHVNEQPENGTDSRWEVIGGDKRLNVTINEKVEFSEVLH